MRQIFCTFSLSIVLIAAGSPVARSALFMDDFNGDTSANYAISSSSADAAATFAFDYSTLGIPVAPNTTDGTTLGLKMEANIAAPTSTEAITLHTSQTFTGSYRVTFDAWINANGPFPGGGGGSTEFLTAGVGGSGNAVNLNGATGSGGWVAVSGEGGSSRDYRMYKDANEQFPSSGQFAAGNDDATSGNNSNAYYSQFGGVDVAALAQGGSQTGTTNVGSFGFEWHEVSLLVGNDQVVWTIDGLEIGTLDANIGASFATDGTVSIGYMDPFTSVSDAPEFSFGLVDNFSVEAVPEPTAASCLLLLGAVGLRRRRR